MISLGIALAPYIKHANQHPSFIIMIMSRSLSAIAALTQMRIVSACTSVESITCLPVSTAPTLDGDVSDWTSVETFETPLTGALTSAAYPNGNLKMQCVYDTDRVYFLFEVPGAYRLYVSFDFNASYRWIFVLTLLILARCSDNADNHKCAAISTMFKMGEEAMLYVSFIYYLVSHCFVTVSCFVDSYTPLTT